MGDLVIFIPSEIDFEGSFKKTLNEDLTISDALGDENFDSNFFLIR